MSYLLRIAVPSFSFRIGSRMYIAPNWMVRISPRLAVYYSNWVWKEISGNKCAYSLRYERNLNGK